MPNIGSLLREEITRLSRKETRSQVDPARKAGIQHRKDIAALKRQVATLERQVATLTRRVVGAAPTAGTATEDARPVRFSAKGLRTHRNRLGLSAAEFGALVGVSAQSIYNWERETAQPRGEQRAKLAALRGIGKKEAAARLTQGAGAARKK